MEKMPWVRCSLTVQLMIISLIINSAADGHTPQWLSCTEKRFWPLFCCFSCRWSQSMSIHPDYTIRDIIHCMQLI